MSENLIYGADILSYGAIPDGKTDCSDAFNKAIENGENLISVPYGRYVIKKPIALTSSTKLCIHPSAIISVYLEGESDGMITADNVSAIIIEGGIFKAYGEGCVFDFKDVTGLKLCSLSVISDKARAITLCGCEGAVLSGITFDTKEDAVTLIGKCDDITVKKASVSQARAFISCGTKAIPCSVTRLNIRNVKTALVEAVLDFSQGKAEGIRIEDTSGSFSGVFLNLSEGFTLDDAELEAIDIYYCESDNPFALPVYLSLTGLCEGLEISGFKRNDSYEALPLIPTLIFKAQSCSKAIIDGITLDNVIASRGKSKTVDMTTARLTNPQGKFIYTLECTVAKNDSLTIPSGDFDSLTLYTR